MEGKELGVDVEQGEDTERRRFLMELEFVQCLANPNYLKFLAQSHYFSDPAFINYLAYLLYWKEQEYAKYIKYPNCLHFLVLLQDTKFREQIADSRFADSVHEQQMYHRNFYRKNRSNTEEDATVSKMEEIATNKNSLPDGAPFQDDPDCLMGLT